MRLDKCLADQEYRQTPVSHKNLVGEFHCRANNVIIKNFTGAQRQKMKHLLASLLRMRVNLIIKRKMKENE